VQTSVACLRVESGIAGRGGRVHVQCAATTRSVYQLPYSTPNPELNPCPRRQSLLYTGRQSCAA
jgi:hypothetical protein